jgi:hypothetical protein
MPQRVTMRIRRLCGMRCLPPLGKCIASPARRLKKHQFETSGYRAKEKAIFAIKRNTRQMSLGVTSSIQMKFFFDNNRTLQDYSVEEIFTGP